MASSDYIGGGEGGGGGGLGPHGPSPGSAIGDVIHKKTTATQYWKLIQETTTPSSYHPHAIIATGQQVSRDGHGPALAISLP